jgi:cyclopropane fatty-acyl-phospholipid synthase-like methyltransferase
MTDNKEWFASWFNTRYYHILYAHRDIKEAQSFIEKIVHFLQLKKDDFLLDLGCGKGRHSIYLNSLGFNVTGADLSRNSISEASKYSNDTLKFIEHDMRNSFDSKYHIILNLFTSFGFFENDNEDIGVLKNIKNGLLPNGMAIIDFMNIKKVISNLVSEETQTIQGITFYIKRYVQNGFIVKEINFKADGKDHTYFEKVKCIDLPKIKSFLKAANFKIKYTFGNYQLDVFDEHTSDRLILVLE